MTRGPCGWCLTGSCCTAPGSTAVHAIECTHCRRCDGYIAPQHDDEEEDDEMARGRSIVEKVWEQLDEDTAKLIATKAVLDAGRDEAGPLSDAQRTSLEEQVMTQRGRCRGKAEALLLMMHPHYATVEAIAQESMARYSAAQRGVAHRSPGLLFDMDHGVITRLANALAVSVVPS